MSSSRSISFERSGAWRHARASVACASLLWLIGSSAGVAQEAERPAALVAARDHLQSVGYQATFDEDGDVAAEHEQYWNFYLKEYRGGLLALALVDVEAKEERLSDCHRWVNALNAEARLFRAYFNPNRALVLEAWLPGSFDRTLFGQFVEAWQEDGGLVGAAHEAADKCRGD
jgi:hypothetical protein